MSADACPRKGLGCAVEEGWDVVGEGRARAGDGGGGGVGFGWHSEGVRGVQYRVNYVPKREVGVLLYVPGRREEGGVWRNIMNILCDL